MLAHKLLQYERREPLAAFAATLHVTPRHTRLALSLSSLQLALTVLVCWCPRTVASLATCAPSNIAKCASPWWPLSTLRYFERLHGTVRGGALALLTRQCLQGNTFTKNILCRWPLLMINLL